jgi:hypothetical protein
MQSMKMFNVHIRKLNFFHLGFGKVRGMKGFFILLLFAMCFLSVSNNTTLLSHTNMAYAISPTMIKLSNCFKCEQDLNDKVQL